MNSGAVNALQLLLERLRVDVPPADLDDGFTSPLPNLLGDAQSIQTLDAPVIAGDVEAIDKRSKQTDLLAHAVHALLCFWGTYLRR